MFSDMSLRLILTRANLEFNVVANAAVTGSRIVSERRYMKRLELTPTAMNYNMEQIAKEKALPNG